MERYQVVQNVLDLFGSPKYLEVGVDQGETFHAVVADYKTAVDPRFNFDIPVFDERKVQYCKLTSDEYFGGVASRGVIFDVVYLDGLHTAEQTLRDIFNAMEYLSSDGVIIIDDVLPNSFDAGLPDLEEVMSLRQKGAALGAAWHTSNGSWMGDVFKDIFFVSSFLQQWSFATVRENHGQTIMWRHRRGASEVGKLSLDQVARLDYRDTILRRDAFNVLPLDEIIRSIQVARKNKGVGRAGL